MLRRSELHRIAEVFDRWEKQLGSLAPYFSFPLPTIRVCALWDTVSAVGLPTLFNLWGREVPFIDSHIDGQVEKVFQALSLHEHRGHFFPTVLRHAVRSEIDQVHSRIDQVHSEINQIHSRIDQVHSRINQVHSEIDQIHSEIDQVHSGIDQVHSEIDQCWFGGYHADAGGGKKPDALAQFPLVWMISKLQGLIEFHSQEDIVKICRNSSLSLDAWKIGGDIGIRPYGDNCMCSQVARLFQCLHTEHYRIFEITSNLSYRPTPRKGFATCTFCTRRIKASCTAT